MEYGLIGEHLAHSFSPEIHAGFGDYDYVICELNPTQVEPFLKERNFKGINVTIPYKETVMPYLDKIDDSAKAIGSVNTIVNANGKLVGYNTDYYGFSYMLKSGKIEIKDKVVAVLGSGGASKTAVAVTRDLGAKEVLVISRRGMLNYETIKERKDIEIIINASPVGMYPNNGKCLVNLDDFPLLTAVADMVYNPAITEIMYQAKAKKLKTVGGLAMLVAQGRRASEIFTGKKIAEEKCLSVIKSVKNQTCNVLLVGMPGCGKTSVGKEIASILNREFVDLDTEFEKQYKISPAQCILGDGEDEFRKKESEIIKSVCKRSKLVISTGGGAVLLEENRKVMKSNSVVVYLKRALELLSKKGRPLSNGENALKDLYQKRNELYQEVSDFSIENETSVKDCAMKIVTEIKGGETL